MPKAQHKKLYNEGAYTDPITVKLEKYSPICAKNQFVALGIDFEFLSGLDNEDIVRRFIKNEEFKKWDKLIFILTHESNHFHINKNPFLKEAKQINFN